MKATTRGYDAASWEIIATAIMERDGFCCQAACGCTTALSVHHIIPRGEHGGDNPENLITLCRTCHDEIEDTDIRSAERIRAYDAQWHARAKWYNRNPQEHTVAQAKAHRPFVFVPQEEPEPAQPKPRAVTRRPPPEPLPLTPERIAAAAARILEWSHYVPLAAIGECCDLALADLLTVLRGDMTPLTAAGVDNLLQVVWKPTYLRVHRVSTANEPLVVKAACLHNRTPYAGRGA